MKRLLLTVLAGVSMHTGAAEAPAPAMMIKSDCTAAEVKALQAPAIVTQFVLKGSVLVGDCTPVTISPERQVLLVMQVFNAPGGYETYLSVYERKGFSESASATFKSWVLGYDAFPVLVNNAHRLLFVHPGPDKTKIAFYANVQTSPSGARFARWELALDKLALNPVPNRYWLLEAGVMPKVYDDRGVFRALIDSRSVEL